MVRNFVRSTARGEADAYEARVDLGVGSDRVARSRRAVKLDEVCLQRLSNGP